MKTSTRSFKPRKRFAATIAASVLGVALITSCSGGSSDLASTPAASETTTSTSSTTVSATTYGSVAEVIAANADYASPAEISTANATTINLNQPTSTTGVSVDSASITISQAGTYILHGDYQGTVIVDAADENVVLILDGANITSSDSAALYIKEGDQVDVYLAEGSSNSLTDGSTYTYADAETDEPKAGLFSAADLVISGTGSLTVTGNYNDGISSKDGLVIASGTITVSAVDDGIRGKDYLVVLDGNVKVDAQGDALKSDNEEDATLGFVALLGGSVDLTAADDGVQAFTDAIVDGASVTISAAGGAGSSVSNDASAKGIKGGTATAIGSGSITVSAADDAVHSDGTVIIDGGTVSIAAGDDGIHADGLALVTGGTVLVEESTEALEGTQVVITGGELDLTASDDGINAAGDVGPYLIDISGGTVVVDATGDGLDSNGDLTISGGTVVVHGPNNNGNGALDSDGTISVTGGNLIAIGSSGMAEAPETSSTQSWVSASLNSTVSAGQVLQITDADGNFIASIETRRDVASVVVSTAEVSDSSTYNVSVVSEQSGTVVGGASFDGTATNGSALASDLSPRTHQGGMGGGPGGGTGGGMGGNGGPSGTNGGQGGQTGQGGQRPERGTQSDASNQG